MKRLFIAVLASGLGMASAAWADDAVLLRYKLAKGDKRTYSRTQAVNQPGSPPSNTEDVVAQEVMDATEDGGRFTRTIMRMKVSMDNAMLGGHVDFDSENKEDLAKAAGNPVLMALTLLLKKPVMVQLSGRGEVRKLDLDEALAPLGPMAAMVKGTLEEAIKQTYLLLPEKPVKPGESWTQESKISNPQFGTLLQKFEYTFAGMEDRGGVHCAKITVKSATEVTRPKKDPPPGGGNDDLTDDGKDGKKGDDTGAKKPAQAEGIGTIYFAVDGYLVDSDVVTPQAGATVKVRMALVKE